MVGGTRKHWAISGAGLAHKEILQCLSCVFCVSFAPSASGSSAVPLRLFRHAAEVRHLDARVVISEVAHARMREAGTPEEKIRLIPNGLDLARFDSGAPHPVRLTAFCSPAAWTR
jgi:hypothetical protein